MTGGILAAQVHSATTVDRPRRLSVDDVLRMVEIGIVDEHERIELVGGVLVAVSPEGADHAHSVARLSGALARVFPHCEIRTQSTLPLDPHTFVEPDILVRSTDAWSWPVAAEVVLIVEIARTSIDRDRGRKACLYARFGIREYWVVDLDRRSVTMHRDPTATGYRSIRASSAATITPPGAFAPIELERILPPRA